MTVCRHAPGHTRWGIERGKNRPAEREHKSLGANVERAARATEKASSSRFCIHATGAPKAAAKFWFVVYNAKVGDALHSFVDESFAFEKCCFVSSTKRFYGPKTGGLLVILTQGRFFLPIWKQWICL
jgi:hypothetical protein